MESAGWFGLTEVDLYALVPVLLGALVILVWLSGRRRARNGRYRY